MNRKWYLVLLLVLAVLCLAACQQDASEEQVQLQVKVIGPEGVSVLDQTVSVATGASALEALTQAAQAADVTFTNDEGFLDNFGGTASTETDGWVLYYNDTLAEVGCAEIIPQEGDVVEFRWSHYAEVWPEYYQ